MENITEINKIIRVEAKGNRALLVYENAARKIVDNSIDEMEQELKQKELGFVRIHPRHLINMNHYKKLSSFSTPAVELDDGTLLPADMNMIEEILIHKNENSFWRKITKMLKLK
ncbi:MAG: hypothetical protein GXO47_11045 [Chlorobi bacterium]|nr:hypothetical protein [Chlorobiota bacterium]